MDLSKLLKIISWVLTGGALVFLWLSIRSETDQMEYSIAALGIWGVGMGVNYFIKRRNEKTEEKD